MQQIPNYLNARQKLFCHWFALTRDAQGAADRCFRAPEKREEALLLLQTPLAQDYLRQVEAALGGEGLTATAEEGYRRLVALVDSMPETYREVLTLRFVLEWSSKEIARTLGLSVGAVNTRISRGRAMLIQRLKEVGYDYDRT